MGSGRAEHQSSKFLTLEKGPRFPEALSLKARLGAYAATNYPPGDTSDQEGKTRPHRNVVGASSCKTLGVRSGRPVKDIRIRGKTPREASAEGIELLGGVGNSGAGEIFIAGGRVKLDVAEFD